MRRCWPQNPFRWASLCHCWCSAKGHRPGVQSLPETRRSMCPPPTGLHKHSPPKGNNEFLRMKICISLPTYPGWHHHQAPPAPAMCTPHVNPLWSHPYGGRLTPQAGQRNHQGASSQSWDWDSLPSRCFRDLWKQCDKAWPGMSPAHLSPHLGNSNRPTQRHDTPTRPQESPPAPNAGRDCSLETQAGKASFPRIIEQRRRTGPRWSPSHPQTYLFHWAASFFNAPLLLTPTTEVDANRHLFKTQPP